MNDAAYDISHLLELEAVAPASAEFRAARTAVVKAELSSVSAAQEALAKELLLLAGHHEELIRQYMSMTDEAVANALW